MKSDRIRYEVEDHSGFGKTHPLPTLIHSFSSVGTVNLALNIWVSQLWPVSLIFLYWWSMDILFFFWFFAFCGLAGGRLVQFTRIKISNHVQLILSINILLLLLKYWSILRMPCSISTIYLMKNIYKAIF